jgi:hypothetical protein
MIDFTIVLFMGFVGWVLYGVKEQRRLNNKAIYIDLTKKRIKSFGKRYKENDLVFIVELVACISASYIAYLFLVSLDVLL